MEQDIPHLIRSLYLQVRGKAPDQLKELPQSGSDRRYFRLSGAGDDLIGAANADVRENRAFIAFARHFREQGVNVPEVYAVSADETCYLLQDLGNESLMDRVSAERREGRFSPEIKALYQASLRGLIQMQIPAGKGIDYSLCIPRDRFDRQSMAWDLQYFKYYCLKLAKIPFDEQLLEDDFDRLCDYLGQAPADYFMFRDFQARNILIHQGEPWFIDFQGGRRGPLQYDLASLLFQAKADIPQEIREELLGYYLDQLEKYVTVDRRQFREQFYGITLIRVLQTLGAYGFRGLFERKGHFIQSIPYALNNVAWILANVELPVRLPHLWQVLKSLPQAEGLAKYHRPAQSKGSLRVTIQSFSYKTTGAPLDLSGNGGGFVFDCRALHNPGRYAQYRDLTGRDPEVIDFLEKEAEVSEFLQAVSQSVEPVVKRYLERGFDHLMVSFGCTGGQHRSVYCADQLADFLRKNFPVDIWLEHVERGWPGQHFTPQTEANP
ncbi:MAG: phosphotransferase [Bacteroidia bacterium]|nr:phosphotransferase [Bacteroidia bacterium]